MSVEKVSGRRVAGFHAGVAEGLRQAREAIGLRIVRASDDEMLTDFGYGIYEALQAVEALGDGKQ